MTAPHVHLPTTPINIRGGIVPDATKGEVHSYGWAVCRICKQAFEYTCRRLIPPTGHISGKAYWT